MIRNLGENALQHPKGETIANSQRTSIKGAVGSEVNGAVTTAVKKLGDGYGRQIAKHRVRALSALPCPQYDSPSHHRRSSERSQAFPSALGGMVILYLLTDAAGLYHIGHAFNDKKQARQMIFSFNLSAENHLVFNYLFVKAFSLRRQWLLVTGDLTFRHQRSWRDGSQSATRFTLRGICYVEKIGLIIRTAA